jgi:glyoxylase-like metal-dependent hydrolase (beta-lactamase superfamily II)
MAAVIPIPAFADNYIWLLREGRAAAVVDPGDATPVLAWLAREGVALTAILNTHHHGDHVGGAKRLSEQLGVPVWAHERTADRSPVEVTRTLHDGDVLVLDGPMPMKWHVLHTPGHARGHVTLVDLATKSIVSFASFVRSGRKACT